MPYAAGTCRGCGTPVKGTRCDACKAARAEQEAARRAELRAAGLCLVCGRAPVAKTKIVEGGDKTARVRKTVRSEATCCRLCLEYYAARSRAG